MAMSTALRRSAALVNAPRRGARALAVHAFKEGEPVKTPSHEKQEEKGLETSRTDESAQQQLAARQAPTTLETLPFQRMADAMTAMQREMDAMLGTFGLMGAPPMSMRMQSPFGLLDALTSDMGFAAPTPARPGRWNRIVPMNVEEDEKQYTLKAEVPGFSKKDIKVTLDPATNTVMTSGEVRHTGGKKEQEAEGDRPHFRSHMSFSRTFTLPPDVDTEQELTARTQDGVLTLTLPKVPAKPAPEVKKIPVH